MTDGNGEGSRQFGSFTQSSLLTKVPTNNNNNENEHGVQGENNVSNLVKFDGFTQSSLITATSSTSHKGSGLNSGSANETTNNGTGDPRYEGLLQDSRSYDGESRSFYTAKLSNGDYITIPRNSNKKEKPDASNEKNDEGSSSSNYGIPINRMLATLKRKREQQNKTTTTNDNENPANKVVPNKQLLAEKWRPRKWVDLIGPEKTHRFMLRWLVAWSPVVFGTSIPDSNSNGDKKNFHFEKIDALGRPQKKILLIHGPPGIGKTTIAHVLAKQAGYDAVEINASDERSGPEVKTKIQNSMNNHRVTGSGKPVCIIADEVEGAAESGFIRVLLNMIEGDSKALTDRLNNSGPKRGNNYKKKRKHKLIQRPIIAVCNDLYATSLRDLRQHAEIVSYSRVSNHSMTNRLREICQQEKIQLETSEVKEIAETTQGDLRSSLNILQFGLTRNETGQLAKKDLNKSWSTLANRVFRRNEDSKDADARNVLADIDGFGEHDKLINGCFSLYPQMSYHDDMVQKPYTLGEWTHFYDQMNAGIYGSQHHQLARYLSQPILAFHSLFSSPANVKNERISSSDYEVYESQRKNSSLCKEFLSYTNPSIRQIFDTNTTTLELAPYALQIISPQLDIPSTAMKAEDRARVTNSAYAMMCLNTSFRKDKLDGGTIIYRIDPPIEQLVIYDPEQRQRQTVGKYSTRMTISDIMHKEKAKLKPQIDKRSLPESDSSLTAKKQKVDDTTTKVKQKRVDFFGRAVMEPEPDSSQYLKEANGNSEHVWVQFVEGFSNAVRKEITWADLWS